MKVIFLLVWLLFLASCNSPDEELDYFELQLLASNVIHFCMKEYSERGGELDIEAIHKAYALAAKTKVGIVLSNGGGIGSNLAYKSYLSCGVKVENGFVPYFLGAPLQDPVIFDPDVDSINASHSGSQMIEIIFLRDGRDFVYFESRVYERDAEPIFGMDCSDGRCDY